VHTVEATAKVCQATRPTRAGVQSTRAQVSAMCLCVGPQRVSLKAALDSRLLIVIARELSAQCHALDAKQHVRAHMSVNMLGRHVLSAWGIPVGRRCRVNARACVLSADCLPEESPATLAPARLLAWQRRAEVKPFSSLRKIRDRLGARNDRERRETEQTRDMRFASERVEGLQIARESNRC
jgi:hypothetical protein